MPVACLFLLLALCCQPCQPTHELSPINICLHAQVSPTEKVVGSVVTTDGLRSAFSARPDTQTVQIFYPFHYTNFTETHWHLVIIEGWFPSVHSFIALARANSPGVIVLFYCLDPAYPGMKGVMAMDVDGYLTNSKALLVDLRLNRPAMYLPLAADTELMQPVRSISRTYGAVYVGAGSNMLKVKPLLSEMLYRSEPYGLRLHGAHWGDDPRLTEAYKGVLPRGTLHEAYASAHVVLAHTIISQSAMGMINNRIFEALSCGSVVMSDYSDILNETFGEVLQFVRSPEDIDRVLKSVMGHENAAAYQRIRDRGRELVVSRHTWRHRVIGILDFFRSLHSLAPSVTSALSVMRGGELGGALGTRRHHHLDERSGGNVSSRFCCSSHNLNSSVPLLAWVVSDHLTSHLDYELHIRPSVEHFFRGQYLVREYTAREWLQLLDEVKRTPAFESSGGGSSGGTQRNCHCDSASDALAVLSQYSVVFTVITHFDPLHQAIISFQQWYQDTHENEVIVVRRGNVLSLDRTQQKYMSYILGIDEQHSRKMLLTFTGEEHNRDNRGVYLSELFDMTLFRDSFEKKLVDELEEESFLSKISDLCGAGGDVRGVGREIPLMADRLKGSPFCNRTCEFPLLSVQRNSFRWQVCFGIWGTVGEASGDGDGGHDVDRASSQANVAICLWSQKEMCIARQRVRYVAPSANFTLLLMGGSLSEWSSFCTVAGKDQNDSSCVLDSIPLSQVVHVSLAPLEFITRMLLLASQLIFLFDENVPTNVCLIGECRGDDGGRDSGIGDGGINGPVDSIVSIEDVIWPLIFGGKHQKAIQLSTQPSAHMSHLIEFSPWQMLPILVQWQRVLNIVLTFGSVYTSGEFVANYANPSVGDSSDINPPAEPPSPFQQERLLVYVNFKNFIPGLDGQACVFHNGVFSMCRYSRDLYLLDIPLHPPSWSDNDMTYAANHSGYTHVPVTATIRVELRGVLYLQYFYVMEKSYWFCLPNPFYDATLAMHQLNSDGGVDAMSRHLKCVNGTKNNGFDVELQQHYTPA